MIVFDFFTVLQSCEREGEVGVCLSAKLCVYMIVISSLSSVLGSGCESAPQVFFGPGGRHD